MKVTLQLPIKVADGTLALFQHPDVTLRTPPFPGMLISGLNMPGIPESRSGQTQQVFYVHERLDRDEVLVSLTPVPAPTYTAEEFLSAVLKGRWQLMPPFDETIAPQ